MISLCSCGSSSRYLSNTRLDCECVASNHLACGKCPCVVLKTVIPKHALRPILDPELSPTVNPHEPERLMNPFSSSWLPLDSSMLSVKHCGFRDNPYVTKRTSHQSHPPVVHDDVGGIGHARLRNARFTMTVQPVMQFCTRSLFSSLLRSGARLEKSQKETSITSRFLSTTFKSVCTSSGVSLPYRSSCRFISVNVFSIFCGNHTSSASENMTYSPCAPWQEEKFPLAPRFSFP